MDFTNISVLCAIVMGLAEVAKKLGINSKLIPLINLVVGVTLGVFYGGMGVKNGIAQGLVIGLMASGCYSSVKNTGQYLK